MAGVQQGSAGQFEDTQAPPNSSMVEYRAVAKSADGTVLATADCVRLSTPGLACTQRAATDIYEIQTTAKLGEYSEFVYRRQVTPDGPYYWRNRHRDGSVSDALSPTGTAHYQVWARNNGRIVAFANCVARSDACRIVVDEWRAKDAVVPPARVGEALALTLGGYDHAVGPDSTVYFLGADAPGYVCVYRYDPATDRTVRLTSIGSMASSFGIDLVDSVGGIYVSSSDQNGGPYPSYYQLDGPSADTAHWVANDLLGCSNRPDGTTVRLRIGDNESSYEIFDPVSGVSTPVDVGVGFYLMGVDSSGRLVVGTGLSGEYAIIDPDC